MQESKQVVFPKMDVITPWEMVGAIAPQLNQDPLVYINGSVTGGLAARNPEWDLPDRILYNCQFALLVIDALTKLDLLPNASFVSAHTVGPRYMETQQGILPWRESDFLIFWASVMARLEGESDVHDFHDKIHNTGNIDFAVLNNHSMPFEKRKREYEKLATNSAEYLGETKTNPLTGMITIPGSSNSLGSAFEKKIALKLKIPISTVSIDPEKSSNGNLPLVEHVLFTWLLSNLDKSSDVFKSCSKALEVKESV